MANNNYRKRQKHRAKIREIRAVKEREKARRKPKEVEARQKIRGVEEDKKTEKVDEDMLFNPGKAIGLE